MHHCQGVFIQTHKSASYREINTYNTKHQSSECQTYGNKINSEKAPEIFQHSFLIKPLSTKAQNKDVYFQNHYEHNSSHRYIGKIRELNTHIRRDVKLSICNDVKNSNISPEKTLLWLLNYLSKVARHKNHIMQK